MKLKTNKNNRINHDNISVHLKITFSKDKKNWKSAKGKQAKKKKKRVGDLLVRASRIQTKGNSCILISAPHALEFETKDEALEHNACRSKVLNGVTK